MSDQSEPIEADVEDLEATEDDAEAVKGGRRADPCEGGE